VRPAKVWRFRHHLVAGILVKVKAKLSFKMKSAHLKRMRKLAANVKLV
jgi:hypothetical protein